MVENCSGCKHAIFDEKWGEYKCAVKKRRCTAAEASIGCARWTKKEKGKEK